MTQQDILFETSRQFQQKLSIAVTRYFLDGGLEPELSSRYQNFLRQRPFTVLQWIVHHSSPSVLKNYLKEHWVSPSDIRRALKETGLSFQTRALLLKALGKGTVSSSPVEKPKDARYLLTLAQLKLFEQLPRLRLALSRFSFSVTEKEMGTDGAVIYYNPEQVISLFRQGRLYDYYFHMVVHCLWLHTAPPSGRSPLLWDLACDISAFYLSQKLLPCSSADLHAGKREIFRFLPSSLELSFAPALCEFLSSQPEDSLQNWQDAFSVDNHYWWYGARRGGDLKIWSHLRRELGSVPSPAKTHFGLNPGNRIERTELRRKAKFDFRSYLRRFTITEEELQIDLDSFDYLPYLYGLEHYGNLPLVEPLEYTETSKVEELVIAIDTSGSCSGEVVQQFLAETCRLLTDKQNFFRRMNVHILQCDSMIQDHTTIHSVEEWETYIRNIKISGRGGTDFTPVFLYTDRMIKEKKFRRLKGLLYFTDGDGIYPKTPPSYETAFVFTDRRFLNQPVPDWAVKLCLNITQGEII
ncbi:MAG: VWA-like domain-containing protein [Ruminococcus sp.]|jgi:predicted metal-dependent peptidase